MPEEKQPEASDILEQQRHLEEVYSETHAQWDEMDALVQGDNLIWDRAEDRATRSSIRSNQARVIIDHTSDNLLPYNPQWHRDKIGDAEDAQPKADAVEDWVEAVWLDCSAKAMRFPAKKLGGDILKYNNGVLEVAFDSSEMPDPPKKGSAHYDAEQREYEERGWNFNPFSLRAPNPRSVLLPPGERRPSLAINRSKWYRQDLKDELDHKREQDAENLVVVEEYDSPGKPYDLVDVTEYFSRDWHGLVVPDSGSGNGPLVLLEANLQRLVPFIPGQGGFGNIPGGEDGANPKYVSQGFLWPARELLKLLDQIISAKAELEMKAAFAPMIAPEELLERIAQLLQQGGNMIPGDVKEVGYLAIQQLPQYLADFQDRVERAIVAATISTVAFGERPVGVDTVGQHAMMLQVSFKRVLETMEQMAFMASEVASMWLKMLATWGAPITVRGKKLSGERLQSNYHILASFPLSDEAVKMQRTQLGAALVAQGLKSRKRHLEEDQGLTNISKEEDQILKEQVKADPILHSAFARKMREELSLQEMYEEEERLLAEERMQGFAQTQAGAGLTGFTPPQSEEEMTAEGAEQQVLVRPPAAGPGAGQRNGGGA